MKEVSTSSPHTLQDYSDVLGDAVIDHLVANAKGLSKTRIVEINSTPEGGVAELLRSQIPLMHKLGLDASWYVLPENDKFFDTTKGLHNCLQGQCSLDHELDIEFYDEYLKKVVRDLPPADLYILHDPQTIGLSKYIKDVPLIWRCHIDTTNAHQPSYQWMSDHFRYFSEIIFSLKSFVHQNSENINIVQPAIDPLSDKNGQLDFKKKSELLKKLDIDEDDKYILQVSRFDKFKNPIGVLEMYEGLQKTIPELFCVLAGNFPSDDPEGPKYSTLIQNKLKTLSGDIKLLTKCDDLQINALQSNASAVIQNSTREGFGLTVAEAMWKRKIVFSREVGGITVQLLPQKTGFYLTDSLSNNIDKIKEAIEHPGHFSAIADAAHNHVKKHFVLPVMVDKYLTVYQKALSE